MYCLMLKTANDQVTVSLNKIWGFSSKILDFRTVHL